MDILADAEQMYYTHYYPGGCDGLTVWLWAALLVAVISHIQQAKKYYLRWTE